MKNGSSRNGIAVNGTWCPIMRAGVWNSAPINKPGIPSLYICNPSSKGADTAGLLRPSVKKRVENCRLEETNKQTKITKPAKTVTPTDNTGIYDFKPVNIGNYNWKFLFKANLAMFLHRHLLNKKQLSVLVSLLLPSIRQIWNTRKIDSYMCSQAMPQGQEEGSSFLSSLP